MQTLHATKSIVCGCIHHKVSEATRFTPSTRPLPVRCSQCRTCRGSHSRCHIKLKELFAHGVLDTGISGNGKFPGELIDSFEYLIFLPNMKDAEIFYMHIPSYSLHTVRCLKVGIGVFRREIYSIPTSTSRVMSSIWNYVKNYAFIHFGHSYFSLVVQYVFPLSTRFCTFQVAERTGQLQMLIQQKMIIIFLGSG